MASDEQRDHADPPEARRPGPPGTPGGPALPATRNDVGPSEPLTGEATRIRPVVVVTAIELRRSAREALAQRLGPGHIVVDIRRAGPDADIVLVPPSSALLLGMLRRRFPQARLLATEFTDDGYGADFRGPISGILDSDIDGYFVAPTMDDLADVTRSAGRAVAGALTGGGSGRRPRPVDLLAANRRLVLDSGHGAGPSVTVEPPQGAITVDLDDWARALDGDPRILADLAWPLILQLAGQGAHVTVVGDPPGSWARRARAAGVCVRPSSPDIPG
ncbi:hypothetical protein [Actinacidiphila acidipaludis]|uniref:Uncharacterized protein n=1 Tax=Actinacidiphila acidipaludis TaxID=2873382 RepID=A0ABS7QCH7_9ACTN|nr:hypothetical protein [Streptomyces acidipaludis]MBY8880858.1 hypothetical protein [Streptomyces acidipaludis]